jgi:hypothetical protein
MKEINKGGVRANSGRKPTNDPKIPITVYIEKSKVEKNGGRVGLATRITNFVNGGGVENPTTTRIIEPAVVKQLTNEIPQPDFSINTHEEAPEKTKYLLKMLDLEKEMDGLGVGYIANLRRKQINKELQELDKELIPKT